MVSKCLSPTVLRGFGQKLVQLPSAAGKMPGKGTRERAAACGTVPVASHSLWGWRGTRAFPAPLPAEIQSLPRRCSPFPGGYSGMPPQAKFLSSIDSWMSSTELIPCFSLS